MEKNLELTKGHWLLVKGAKTIIPTLLQITARLAEVGPVRVVDGGFRYNPLLINYILHFRPKALQRIKVSQAESCHDLLSFLEDMPTSLEPFVVLDLMSLFFDPFVHIDERRRKLGLSLQHLDRLAKGSGGLVSVHPPILPSQTESDLMKMVTEAAKDTFHMEMAARASLPMRNPPPIAGL